MIRKIELDPAQAVALQSVFRLFELESADAQRRLAEANNARARAINAVVGAEIKALGVKGEMRFSLEGAKDGFPTHFVLDDAEPERVAEKTD